MRISIVEVGPRDGLQNEKTVLPVEVKVELVERLAASGITRIEATSFVRPDWVPQLADASDLMQRIKRRQDVTYSALVPNLQGLRRAVAAQADEVAIFVSASESHNRKNSNKSIAETLSILTETATEALQTGMRVRGYVSCAFGCPYEGKVSSAQVIRVTEALLAMGVYEVSIGDTIGVATPRQVQELFDQLLRATGPQQLAAHFHDTRGTALANVTAALAAGLSVFDSSIGGLGGCPYAPGAAGNVSTEDLVYMLAGMGYETGIDLDRLVEAGRFAQRALGRELPSKVLKSACPHRNEEEAR